MGSRCSLVWRGEPAAGDRLVAEVERLEQCWSRFRPDSELCRLNLADSDEVTVSDDLADIVAASQLAWSTTGGLFDPSILDALELAGYPVSFERLARLTQQSDQSASRPSPGVAHVTVIRASGSPPVIHRPIGLRLDLGGIGKGLAADRVATDAIAEGVESIIVNLGGDVRVAGRAPAGGWSVGVEDPFHLDRVWFDVTIPGDASGRASGGAVATSSSRGRRWMRHGVAAHHLIDPSTGEPARGGTAAVIVVAAECWWAEVVAKAALVAGGPAAAAELARQGVTGWVVAADGEVMAVSPLSELPQLVPASS